MHVLVLSEVERCRTIVECLRTRYHKLPSSLLELHHVVTATIVQYSSFFFNSVCSNSAIVIVKYAVTCLLYIDHPFFRQSVITADTPTHIKVNTLIYEHNNSLNL